MEAIQQIKNINTINQQKISFEIRTHGAKHKRGVNKRAPGARLNQEPRSRHGDAMIVGGMHP